MLGPRRSAIVHCPPPASPRGAGPRRMVVTALAARDVAVGFPQLPYKNLMCRFVVYYVPYWQHTRCSSERNIHMTQQTNPPQPFGSRVRELLDRKNMSQAELAEKAGLTPPTVSKLLSDPPQREVRLEDVFSFARALQTTPAELAHGTDAAKLVDEWVPRSHVEAEARARVEAQQALSKLTAEREAQDARIRSVETSAAAMREQIARLSGDLQAAQAGRVAANAKLAALERQLDEATRQTADRAARLADARAQVQSLAQQVQKTEGDWVGKAVVASLVSFVGGALLSSGGSPAPRSPSGRKPPGGSGRRKR